MKTIRFLVACMLLFCGISAYAQIKEEISFDVDGLAGQYYDDINDQIICGIPAHSPTMQREINKRFPSIIDNQFADTPAQFPGGARALLDFVSKNIEEPDSESCAADTDPTVVVAFVVEKDGTICNDNVLVMISSQCPTRDQAAIDFVKKLPNFIPAKHHGENIPVLYRLHLRLCQNNLPDQKSFDFQSFRGDTIFCDLVETPRHKIRNRDNNDGSQKPKNVYDQNVLPFNVNVEVPAQFPGGEEALQRFIRKNLVYPVETVVHGSVIVYFIVNKDGKVSNAFVRKGLSAECDKAAIDLVKKFPDFIPAKHHGDNIAVIYTLQVKFYIN